MDVALVLILFMILAFYGVGAYFLGLRHATQDLTVINNHYPVPDFGEQWHWPERPQEDEAK